MLDPGRGAREQGAGSKGTARLAFGVSSPPLGSRRSPFVRPGLVAPALLVGIANFETFLERTHPHRRYLREAEYGSLGEDREWFREVSPIYHAERITAAMMVVHGANDPRVPVSEAEQMVDQLRTLGRSVEYLRFEDEGHGVVKIPNQIVTYGAVAAFLDRHLPTRGEEPVSRA